MFANGPGDLGSVPGRVIPKTQKMVLDASLLNTQHYKVWIKGKVGQSREGVAPSPTPWCSSYRKGSLRVTLDYGRQLYLLIFTKYIFFVYKPLSYIFTFNNWKLVSLDNNWVILYFSNEIILFGKLTFCYWKKWIHVKHLYVIYKIIIIMYQQHGFLWFSLSLAVCPYLSSLLASPLGGIKHWADEHVCWSDSTGMSMCRNQ